MAQDGGMGAGQQAAARDCTNLAAMAAVEQRDHHIDHGEACPDQQDGGIRVERGDDIEVPGVRGAARRRAFGRKIPHRQGDRIDVVMPSAGHRDAITRRCGMQRHHLIGDEVEPMRAIGTPDLPRQDVLDIGAVERARDEGQAIGRRIDRAALLLRQIADPVEEVIRTIGEGAHIVGTDVQEMPGIAGGIGQAAAELRAALDEIDVVVGMGTAKEMDGEK